MQLPFIALLLAGTLIILIIALIRMAPKNTHEILEEQVLNATQDHALDILANARREAADIIDAGEIHALEESARMRLSGKELLKAEEHHLRALSTGYQKELTSLHEELRSLMRTSVEETIHAFHETLRTETENIRTESQTSIEMLREQTATLMKAADEAAQEAQQKAQEKETQRLHEKAEELVWNAARRVLPDLIPNDLHTALIIQALEQADTQGLFASPRKNA